MFFNSACNTLQSSLSLCYEKVFLRFIFAFSYDTKSYSHDLITGKRTNTHILYHQTRSSSPLISYLLLVPPSLLQLGVQAVGGSRPLLCKPAYPPLHEAERLLSCPDLIQQHREVCAEGSLGG